MNASRISRGFDRIAPVYESLGRFFVGRSLFQSQVWEIPRLPENCSVLIVGGGAGGFLSELLASGKARQVCYVDISPKMIELSRTRIEKLLRDTGDRTCQVEFITGTVDDIPAWGDYDVVITNFFLDLFTTEETVRLVAKLDCHLRPGGLWCFSDFCLKDRTSSKVLKELYISSLYASFGMFCGISGRRLPPYEAVFRAADYEARDEASFGRDMIRSVIYRKPHPLDKPDWSAAS